MKRCASKRRYGRTAAPRLRQLGDVLGSLHYMGQCPACGRQHMSTHAFVLPAREVNYPGHGNLCERCAVKHGAVR